MSVEIRKSGLIVILLLAVVLSGCLGGGQPTEPPSEVTEAPTGEATEEPTIEATLEPTEDIDAAYTQAYQTLVAEMTLNAPPTNTPVVPDAPAAPAPTHTFTVAPTNTLLPTPLPTNTPLPTDTPVPTNTLVPLATNTSLPVLEPAFRLVFEDDFSADTGWVTEYSDQVAMHFGMGGYVMQNKVVQDIVWSVRNTYLDNVRVEAIGHTLKGRRTDYYGVTCNFGNGSNYYAAVVGNDGSYGIARQLDGNLEFVKWELDQSGTVYTFSDNHIRADCMSNKIVMYVNGQRMMELENLTFTAGRAGFAVGTGDLAGHEVLFTYFAVYRMVE